MAPSMSDISGLERFYGWHKLVSNNFNNFKKNKFILLICILIMTNKIYGQEKSFSFEDIQKVANKFEYSDHKFTNSDNLQIAYYKFSTERPVAKIMFIHGGGSYSKGYFSLAKTLNEKFNIETILMDLVGHGNSQGKRGDCVSVESVYKDIKQLRELINVDSIPTFLGGHSSGGGLVLNYNSWGKDTSFRGFIFVSPEFGYKSKTAKKGRIDFAKVKIGKFILNAFSGGSLNQHSYAVELNYPKEILDADKLIVSKLTVNMANTLTPQNPKKQMSNIDKPIAIYIGENDEVFDSQKVVEYKTFQKNNSLKSFDEVVENENHLSILLNIGDRIGKKIIEWSK